MVYMLYRLWIILSASPLRQSVLTYDTVVFVFSGIEASLPNRYTHYAIREVESTL